MLALLAVLAVIGALAAPSLLGGSGEQGSGQDNAQDGGNGGRSDGGAGGNSENQDSQGSGEGNAASANPQPADSSQAPEEEASPSQDSQGEGDQQSQGGLTAEAAEQTVRDHYQVAASDNYQDAWNYLSSSYQQEIGAPSSWTSQFQTLQSVEFTSGPTAQLNGDTATVSFSTRAVHTDRVDQPSGTATLVPEGGEWKIASIDVA